MNKKKYEGLKINMLVLQTEDIVSTSQAVTTSDYYAFDIYDDIWYDGNRQSKS